MTKAQSRSNSFLASAGKPNQLRYSNGNPKTQKKIGKDIKSWKKNGNPDRLNEAVQHVKNSIPPTHCLQNFDARTDKKLKELRQNALSASANWRLSGNTNQIDKIKTAADSIAKIFSHPSAEKIKTSSALPLDTSSQSSRDQDIFLQHKKLLQDSFYKGQEEIWQSLIDSNSLENTSKILEKAATILAGVELEIPQLKNISYSSLKKCIKKFYKNVSQIKQKLECALDFYEGTLLVVEPSYSSSTRKEVLEGIFDEKLKIQNSIKFFLFKKMHDPGIHKLKSFLNKNNSIPNRKGLCYSLQETIEKLTLMEESLAKIKKNTPWILFLFFSVNLKYFFLRTCRITQK